MIIVNEYFEGNVKSLGYDTIEGKSTIGVIEKGEYEFGTSQHETMTIIEGSLSALLPGQSEWKLFNQGEKFEIDAGESFKVQVKESVSYLCNYK